MSSAAAARLRKEYGRPLSSFPEDQLRVLDTLCFSTLNNVAVVGSGSMRDVDYASDIDAFERCPVEASTRERALGAVARAFKNTVRALLKMDELVIGDIKAGIDERCTVFPDNCWIVNGRVRNYNQAFSLMRLRGMHSGGLITDREAREWSTMVRDAGPQPSPEQWVTLSYAIAPWKVRWRPADILDGSRTLRGGTHVTLEQALSQGAPVKIDVSFWSAGAGNRYIDCSLIAAFAWEGEALNDFAARMPPITTSIATDLMYYAIYGKWMKVSKRMLSLAAIRGRHDDLRKLVDISNSDAGRLYQLTTDIGTLTYVLENGRHLSRQRVQLEMDIMKSRVVSAYDVPALKSVEKRVLNLLDSASRVTNDVAGARALLVICSKLDELLSPLVSEGALEMLRTAGLHPVPRVYLP